MRRCGRAAVLICLLHGLLVLMVASADAQTLDAPAVRRALLEGAEAVGGQGSPGPLALFDERAIAILGGDIRVGVPVPVVAAAPLGRGRLVAFAHDGYLSNPALENRGLRQLVRNAVRWSAGVARPTVLLVRAADVAPVLADMADVRTHPGGLLTDADLAGVHVVVAIPWFDDWWPGATEALRRFGERGGGLLVSGLGWGQLQLRPDLSLRTLPAAPLLAAAGLGLGGDVVRQGERPLVPLASPLLNGATALGLLSRGGLSPGDAAVALTAASNALAIVPAGHPLGEAASRLAARGLSVVPTAERPLRPTDDPGTALSFRLMETAPLEPGPAAAAADFPGSVPANARRITDTVLVEPSGGAWVSTGLYAAPGELVRATVLPADPPPRAGSVRLRIGAHSDELFHLESWERAPAITRRVVLGGAPVEVRPAFGGLVYVERPADQARFRVVIEGAVRAPRFVLGRSRIDTWRADADAALAPWGELESGSIILTVQSPLLRVLERPDLVLQAWDRVQEANASLAAWPPAEGRPMRIVFDRQISAGYMHSGYPVMAPLGSQTAALDPFSRARAAEPGDLWGLLHELGHNHQSRAWTFEGTGEVTVNLFTMHALEGAVRAAGTHPEMTAAGQAASLRRYFAGGARFETWQREPFIALVMYRQVIDAFGWDPFRRAFGEYRSTAAAPQWSEDQRRDQWLIRLSRAVARDLGPFFAAWGIPVSAEARAAVANLPAWLPEPDFPARYR